MCSLALLDLFLLEIISSYFSTLKEYLEFPATLEQEIEDVYGVPTDQAKNMMTGVKWVDLVQNALLWYGIENAVTTAENGIIETIESTTKTLIAVGDFDSSPLPQQSPYRIINSEFIEGLFKKLSDDEISDSSLFTQQFPILSKEDWNSLRVVGMLKKRPVKFQSGTSVLSEDGESQLNDAAESLRRYPKFRLVIKGHSGVRGDKEANATLSQNRAESVADYLKQMHSISPNRMKIVGVGGIEPLTRRPGESNRGYNTRLKRVELILIAE